LGDDDGHDLLLEVTAVDRRHSVEMAFERDLVLGFATDAELLREVLGGETHVGAADGAPEAVEHHRVEDLVAGQTHAVAGATVLQQPRRPRHVLHAADEIQVAVAGLDRRRRHRHGGGARNADAVDGDRRHAVGDAGLELGLAGGVLAEPGLDDVAEDDFVELVAGDAGALERLSHHERAELDCRRVGEAALEPALGGPYGRENDDIMV
jgi:hypothetical protein